MRHTFDIAVQFHRNGQLSQAESLYRQILHQLPHQPDTLNALGMLLTQQGKPEEAIRVFRKAIQNNGKCAHFHLNLSEAFRAAKQYEEASASIKRALKIQANYPEAQFCLGSLLHDQGHVQEAITYYRQTLDALPNFVPAHNSLGVALQELGQLNESVTSLLEAIRLQPDFADAHFNLANTYMKLEQDARAISHYKLCLRLAPDLHLAHCRFAEALMEQINTTDAEIDSHFAIAERTLSNSPEFLNALGKFRIRQGQIDTAQDILKRSIEIKASPAAMFDYTQAKKFTTEENWLIKPANRLLSSKELNAEERGLLHFSLAKIQDDIGNYDNAFKHFQQGNAAIRKLMPYDRQQEEHLFTQLRNLFTPQFFHVRKNIGLANQQLIFIVGMPRSGTTLTEQVISCHPKALGCGELLGINGIKEKLSSTIGSATPFPDLLIDLDDKFLKEIAKTYLLEINQLFPGNHSRLIDKLPHNFLNIGLIALLFPNASIINIRRNPLDNCLSIYFQKFLRGHPYAYDLLDIGHQYLLYVNLMTHWHAALPNRILDLSYDDLVSSPEYWSRKLIEHVGLEWDNTCLAPHKLERTVKTASYWQVRQPIYKTSVKRWEHYEKYLDSLKEMLGYTED